MINDSARDGCWTNIGEVKLYAEDKLLLSGAKIVKNAPNIVPSANYGSAFEVNLLAYRDNQGWCIASFTARFTATDRGQLNDKLNGIVVYSEISGNEVIKSNLNNSMINLVKDAIAEWNAVK